jgi:predicted AAA+ superfamily ATPase
MYARFVERRAEEALSDTPVVLIVGPRRAGKTTLVRKLADSGRTYIGIKGVGIKGVRVTLALF